MAVTLSLFAGAGAQFFDNSGVILSGGKVYTYAAGTTTPLATYTTNSGASFHTNPIVLDAAGRVPNGGEIWLTLGVGYKFVVKTSAEVLIATYDNIPSSAQPPAANDADSIMYEQGYAVTAGSFVIGETYRILTVGNTNFTLIGATSNTVGLHFIATGSGTGNGTAEVSQTVETKLRQFISAADFGVVGDGVVDDTAALQAFFNEAQAQGGDCILPKGTYRVTSPILIYETSTQRHDGARIRGAGINDTIIDFRGSGRVFDIRGIPPSNGSGTQTGTYFIWGLEMSNFTIDGANKTGTTDGFRLVGLWNSTFDNLTIKNLRYGIVSEGDLTYNSNPDWSSTANCKVDTCNFERLTESGFYNSVVQAASGWSFSHSLFVLCGQSGIRLASGGIRITECGFAGCGWSSEIATPNVNGAGIVFSGNVTVASQITVENCEFDTNFTAHIDFEYAGGIRLSGNRYIFNDRYSYGAICPTAGAIRIAAFSSSNAVQNVLFSNEFFRLDAGPTVGTPICFNFANNANVQNIRVFGASFSDNNGTLNFTRVTGQTASNSWARNNYDLQLSDLSNLTAIVPGRPFGEYIGQITGSPSTTGGNVETVLPFATQESVNLQIFSTSLYNTTTGVFTCPVAGYYDVDWVVPLQASISTDYNTFRLYKNTSLEMEWSGAGTGGTRTYYQGRRRVFCNANDTLEMREVCSVARTITGGYSYLRISLNR